MNIRDLDSMEFYVNKFSAAKSYLTLIKEFIEGELRATETGTLRVIKSEYIEYSKDAFDEVSNHSVTFVLEECFKCTIELVEFSSTISGSAKKDVIKSSIFAGSLGGVTGLALGLIGTALMGGFVPAGIIIASAITTLGGATAGTAAATANTGIKTSIAGVRNLARNKHDVLKTIHIHPLRRKDGTVEYKMSYALLPGVNAKIKIDFLSNPKDIKALKELLAKLRHVIDLIEKGSTKITECTLENFNINIQAIVLELKHVNNLITEINGKYAKEMKYFSEFAISDRMTKYCNHNLSDSEIDNINEYHQQKLLLTETTKSLTTTTFLYTQIVTNQERLSKDELYKLNILVKNLERSSRSGLNDFNRQILIGDKTLILTTLYKLSSLRSASNAEIGQVYNKLLLSSCLEIIKYMVTIWQANLVPDSIELKVELDQYNEIISSLHEEMLIYEPKDIDSNKQNLMQNLNCLDKLVNSGDKYKTNTKVNAEFIKGYIHDIYLFLTSEILNKDLVSCRRSVLT